MYPVWWGLHDTLIPLDSTYASPGPPKMKTKIWKKCSSDYFHILHIVELWCDFKMFVGPWSIYIYNVYEFCLINVYWFRATGGYMCSCGWPSNLVTTTRCTPFEYYNQMCSPIKPKSQNISYMNKIHKYFDHILTAMLWPFCLVNSWHFLTIKILRLIFFNISWFLRVSCYFQH